MSNYTVISSDSHVIEPPNTWSERMDISKFGDRIPKLVEVDGFDTWYTDGVKSGQVGALSQAGLRFDRPEEIIQEGQFANVRRGAYIPDDHIKDMEIDGVYGGLLYPSVGLALYERVPDPELTHAIFQAYNDWLVEFCRSFPKRLKGVSMILIEEDVNLAITEMVRCAKLGLNSAMISSYPRAELTYDQPLYEPFWAAAQENNVTLNLHVTTNRPSSDPGARGHGTAWTASWVQHDYWVRMSLCHIIFSGVLERFPRLKIANVEHEIAWLPFFMHRFDVAYREKQQSLAYRFANSAVPSDFMRNNVYHSFQEDALGIEFRDYIGVENLMWGSDYPHSESTFPRSREILEEILEGVPEEEKALIAGGNAAKVYEFG